MNFDGVLSLICVALLWGVTNPLMGKGSSGIQKVQHPNFLVRFGSELKFLLSNWKFVLPFLVNQCGSILFYFTLSSIELSIAVPLANGLTFLFTSVTGQCLGEHPASPPALVETVACAQTFDIFSSIGAVHELLPEWPPNIKLGRTWIGMAFVLLGVVLCLMDKM